MPIRAVPFESITEALVVSLKDRRVREDRTLDFKREFDISSPDSQSEFLKDVTAFANASGGTLLYGVEEGKGENEGLIGALPGLDLDADATHRLIDNLLRDGVDERPMGILHMAVPREDGRFYYVVRVPPSPLAPHMVTSGRHRSKFFLRASTTASPMDARQIKETALKSASAYDRAMENVEHRRRILIRRANRYVEEGGRIDHPSDQARQAILHVAPLFALPGGFALTDQEVVNRLAKVSILGWPADNYSMRFALDGLYVSYRDYARAAFLRSGIAEFQEFILDNNPAPALSSSKSTPPLPAWKIEEGVLHALDSCAGLTADGLLPLPLVVALTLTSVDASRLQRSPSLSSLSPATIDQDEVEVTPIVLHAWDQMAAVQVRSLFDEMYQGWGFSRSSNYVEGKRIWWGHRGREHAPRPLYWMSAWVAGF
jgi:hypothetical protein